MALEFTNIIKGVVSQTLLKALLERGGYRVTRLGIEEVFAEVKHLDMQEYLGLDLPEQLRHLPDLLVAEVDMSNVFLVEVKFRKVFDSAAIESLAEEIRLQRAHWPGSYAVIMISQPFVPNGKFHQDYIRVLKPGELEVFTHPSTTVEETWNRLHQLQRVFKRFNNDQYIDDVRRSADTLPRTLQDLAKL